MRAELNEIPLNEIPKANGYCYLLECANGSFYCGSTKNIFIRLRQYQAGEGANFTRKNRPVKLVYVEPFDRVSSAFYREKQLQRWSRAKKLALIKNDIQLLKALSGSTGSPTRFGEPVEQGLTPY